MTSEDMPGAEAQAAAWGQEVLNFYYIVDPEERLQLGWRAHELVLTVAKNAPDVVFFLDKSGRPLQHLFRKAWQYSQAEGEVQRDQFPPQVGFLHIGRSTGYRNTRRILESADLPQLAQYYCRKLGFTPRKVLVVDEILGTGQTRDLALEVVEVMFPGVKAAAFFFQDSTGRFELFVKPKGDRQATWKTSFDDHIAYGLQGVTDLWDGHRAEYRDILAYRPKPRQDWLGSEDSEDWLALADMEAECLMGFGIKDRLISRRLSSSLEGLATALVGIPDCVHSERGVRYLRRVQEALNNGLPRSRDKSKGWVAVHEDLDRLRVVTREQIIWLRLAACYWNKLECMVDATQAVAGERAPALAKAWNEFRFQGDVLQQYVHWASEWNVASLFEKHGPSALQHEVQQLRRELADCVAQYWHFRQYTRPVLV